jgi:predicted O-methyltransferase YrrM
MMGLPFLEGPSAFMSNRRLVLDDALYEYFQRHSFREPEILKRLRAETGTLPRAGMQISPEQGQLMRLLIELIGVRRIIEIGVFTGYSSLSMALALPEDGEIVACDVSEAFTAVARRYWAEAGLADRIHLHLAPAVETLDTLIANGESGRFDMAFIDADKENYDAYYEKCLALVRPGGLILVDNVLWSGRVVRTDDTTDDTRAIRALNQKLHADERITVSMLPIGDGLTLARKRP